MKYNIIVIANIACNETRKVVLDLNKGASFREVVEEGSFTKFYSNDTLLAAYPTNLVVSVEKVEE